MLQSSYKTLKGCFYSSKGTKKVSEECFRVFLSICILKVTCYSDICILFTLSMLSDICFEFDMFLSGRKTETRECKVDKFENKKQNEFWNLSA